MKKTIIKCLLGTNNQNCSESSTYFLVTDRTFFPYENVKHLVIE